MYYYKTRQIGLLLILSGCLSAGLYRKAHSLSFSSPVVQYPLLSNNRSQGWHAQYSASSVQAVHNALIRNIRDNYNSEKGLTLYLASLRPDYKITVGYTERHDHSLKITIQAHSLHKPKLLMEKEIKIPPNASLKSFLEKEAILISLNLAHQHPSQPS